MSLMISEGRIPERIRRADPLQSKVAALVCHFGRRRVSLALGHAGVARQPPLGGWGAEHFAAPQLDK